MINLCVESYCQNCPYFEPVAEKLVDCFDSMAVETRVHCSDMNKCNIIHNQILEEQAKKLETQ